MDEAIISTKLQDEEEELKNAQVEAFQPSSNQMRDYFYDDEDDYYGE